jgi:hypothetical protein
MGGRMSLNRIFKEMRDVSIGAFSSHERNFSYIFINPENAQKHYDNLFKKFSNGNWKMEKFMKQFPVKKDDHGRDIIFSLGKSISCPIQKQTDYPVISGSIFVTTKACKNCEFRTKIGNKKCCSKIAEKNKDFSKNVITEAVKNVEEMFGERK